VHPRDGDRPENVGPHRYRLHQDNNRTPRIDPKRCSVKSAVSRAGCGAGSARPRYQHRPGLRQTPR
jgi:hypothetical protein